jgi:hypothetical protein
LVELVGAPALVVNAMVYFAQELVIDATVALA